MAHWADDALRSSGARLRAALAARFRDIDLAEEALAEAVARAAALDQAPDNPAGWLWRVADRVALDQLRRARPAAAVDMPDPAGPARDDLIPDARLGLFFAAAHPALAPDVRAALILRLLGGLPVEAIASAFLVPVPTMLQRLTRAKAKIRLSGIGFDPPMPSALAERLEAVLIALDVLHAAANADAAGQSEPARGLAATCLELSALLAELLPDAPDVRAQAAAFLLSEARRPARLSAGGVFVPLDEQDPAQWDHGMIKAALPHLRRAVAGAPRSPRSFQARLQALWCGRTSLAGQPPWAQVLALYDEMLGVRDDPFVRLNRAVALGALGRAAEGLDSLAAVATPALAANPMWHAVRADLFARTGQAANAEAAFAAALACDLPPAERRFLDMRRAALRGQAFRSPGR
jgi:RNA polymerase sigma-70 factor (ECF subfamily)